MKRKFSIAVWSALFLVGILIAVVSVLNVEKNMLLAFIFLFPGIFLTVLSINMFARLLRRRD